MSCLDDYMCKASGIGVMKRRFSMGTLGSAALALPFRSSANVFVLACLATISTFTAARVPAPASPHQAKANQAKSENEAESESCPTKPDALADRIEAPATRDASGDPEKVSEESESGASAANLTLKAPSTTDSMIDEGQDNAPETDNRQESHGKELRRPDARSPQQCTLSKGSRETEHVPPR
jgi:hypothetical protein